MLNAAIGGYSGKGGDEQSLLRDAFYATYFLLRELRERGIDAVFEQHGSRQRTTDFGLGRQLGVRDHLLVIHKPVIKPHWMSQTDYDSAPLTSQDGSDVPVVTKVGGTPRFVVYSTTCVSKWFDVGANACRP